VRKEGRKGERRRGERERKEKGKKHLLHQPESPRAMASPSPPLSPILHSMITVELIRIPC
jgi:hypothetical protein